MSARVTTRPGARRAAGALAAAVTALAVLTACGGGDSTVSGTPESETMAPPPAADRDTTSTRVPADRDEGRYTEAPATVAEGAPGYESPVVGARERGYLAVLEEKDIETAELSDSLVAAGNTICRIRTTGGAADETTTIADAVAGQIRAGGYSDREEAEISRIVVDAAAGQLCP